MLSLSPLRNSLMPPFRGGDIFRDMLRAQGARQLLSDEKWSAVPTEYPAINIWKNGDAAILTTEIPGISPDNLDISVAHNTLTLRGERTDMQTDEGVNYHRRERWQGKFVRSMELPFAVDADKVEAEFYDGVLYIKLPRAEEDKPKQIAVKIS